MLASGIGVFQAKRILPGEGREVRMRVQPGRRSVWRQLTHNSVGIGTTVPKRQQRNQRYIDERQRQRQMSPQGLYGPQRAGKPQFRLR